MMGLNILHYCENLDLTLHDVSKSSYVDTCIQGLSKLKRKKTSQRSLGPNRKKRHGPGSLNLEPSFSSTHPSPQFIFANWMLHLHFN